MTKSKEGSGRQLDKPWPCRATDSSWQPEPHRECGPCKLQPPEWTQSSPADNSLALVCTKSFRDFINSL